MQNNMTRLNDLAGMNGYYLFCSPSGRVKYTSGSLRNLLSEDLTGRNLNDFLEDQLTVDMIIETRARRTFDFSCRIKQVLFTGTASYCELDAGIEILLYPGNVDQKHDRWTDPEQTLFIVREINGMLGGMLPTAEALVDMVEPEGAERVDMLRCYLFRMNRMSRGLEDSVIISLGQMKPHLVMTDVTQLCAQVLDQLEPICEKAKVRLNRKLPDHPIKCAVDPSMVTRMICHLACNAIQAQPKGGVLEIMLKESTEQELTITAIDQGRGFSNGLPESTFHRRDQRELFTVAGMGMGLALTRAFAESHGGRMMVMGSENSGTVAKIILPKMKEGETGDLTLFRSPFPAYGEGIDTVLVEMSPVADWSFYRKTPPQKAD